MSWSLPLNLALRKSAVLSCYPKVIIYALGDAAHLAEHSDHNADSRGVVHALDIMVAAGTPEAAAVLKWHLSDTTDLEYVIHDHKIYNRSRGFAPAAYSGADPHTNHIHVSGKHGTTGANSHTGVGYDLAAENYRPKGTPCKPYIPPVPPQEDDMALTKQDVITILHTDGIIPNFAWASDKATNPYIATQSAIVAAGNEAHKANVKLDELLKAVADLKAVLDGLPKA